MPERLLRVVRTDQDGYKSVAAEVALGPDEEITVEDEKPEPRPPQAESPGPLITEVHVGVPKAEEEEAEQEALEEKTVVELEKIAADLDIPGRSSMNKDELIEAIEARTVQA